MSEIIEIEVKNEGLSREYIEDSFTRITGAELRIGCDVKLLLNAEENYPVWLEAIKNAKDRIYFESYIIHDDEQGYEFADAMIAKAKEGVEVKLIYDWMGGFGKTAGKFWKRLEAGGVEVRCYNPLRLTDPIAVVSRNHRKTLSVDGELSFVSGLCVGQDWVGYPKKGIPPWRDSGVQLKGKAVADVEAAFAYVWQTLGTPLKESRISNPSDFGDEGNKAVRIVASIPTKSHVYRIDQVLCAGARESIWLTDAYFLGDFSYLQSIMDAAESGVDVRILIPGKSDIKSIRDVTRAIYRPLLESGVRMFEWNGSMIHAKTAVFDGRISRIGSTNLNVASWFGNCEIDALIEDQEFGKLMQETYLNDISESTEMVLVGDKKKVRLDQSVKREKLNRGAGGVTELASTAIGTAVSLGNTVISKKPIGGAESHLLFLIGLALTLVAVLFIFFPRGASIPLIIVLLLLAFPAFAKAFSFYRR